MAVDTLAYTKALEAGGLDRRAAELHIEALTKHVLPALVTKPDLDALEARIERAIKRSAHQLTVRLFGLTLGVVGLMNAVLFALLRLIP